MTVAPKSVLRLAALLLALMLAAGVLLATGGSSGILPWTAAKAKASQDSINTASATCSIQYGALDPTNAMLVNSHKETPATSLGLPVTQRDEAGIKKELTERRTCGTDGKFDPELTATQYAKWSSLGLTSEKVAYTDAGIESFKTKIAGDSAEYAKATKELTKVEDESSFQIKAVPAGLYSVYAVPDGKKGVTTQFGHTGKTGTAAVFTHGTGANKVVVMYRLECGFQVIQPEKPANVTVCKYDDCGPKPVAPPVTPPTTHFPTCAETGTCGTSHTPTCVSTHGPGWSGTYPVCKGPASEMPSTSVSGRNTNPGTDAYVAPQDNTPLPTKPRVDPKPSVGGSSTSGGNSSGTGGTPTQPTKDPAPAPTKEPAAPPTSAPQPSTPACPVGMPTC